MITFDQTGVWISCLFCETARGDITMLRKLLFVLIAAAALGTAALLPSPASAWHGRGHIGWGNTWGIQRAPRPGTPRLATPQVVIGGQQSPRIGHPQGNSLSQRDKSPRSAASCK